MGSLYACIQTSLVYLAALVLSAIAVPVENSEAGLNPELPAVDSKAAKAPPANANAAPKAAPKPAPKKAPAPKQDPKKSPKQDPKKLTLENEQRQKKEPTMDPGENLVMFGVVLLCLLFVSGIMVSAR